MKKMIAVLVVIFVLFAVYLLKTDTGLTQKLLKPVVVYQCGVELEATRLWKVSTALLSEEKRNQLQTKICGCVGENALKDIPATTLLHAVVDEQVKKQVVQQGVLNTLKGCVVNEVLKATD